MKDIILRRPMAFACGAFLCSLLLFMNINAAILPWIGLAVLILCAATVIICEVRKRRFLPLLSVLLALLISCTAAYCFGGIYYKNKVAVYEGVHKCEFIVTDNVKYEPYYTVSHVTITKVGGEKCNIRTVVISSFMSVMSEGSTYTAELELTPTKEDYAFGVAYDFSKGFAMSAYCDDTSKIAYLGKGSDFPYTQISKLQKQISVFFNMYLEDDAASLCKAMLDGDKSDFDTGTNRAFSQLGISHMIAISGMHLSVIVGFFAVFIDKFKLRKKGAFLILTIITLLYVFLTGFIPSVVRSAVMLIMTYAAFWLRRRSDAVSALVLSVALICLVNTFSVFDIGLWLSFTATLGILLVGAPLSQNIFKEKRGIFFKILKWVLSTVFITLSATAFTFPVILLYFKELSVVAVIANLLFSLPLTLLLFLIMLMVIVSPLGFLTEALAYVTEILCRFTVWVAEKTASPTYLFSLDYVFLYFVCAAAIVLTAWLLVKRRRGATIGVFAAVMALVIIANAVTFTVDKNELGIGYYSRGNNDALYVKSGTNVLIIDNSSGGYSFINEALQISRVKNYSRVTLMLTHYHIYLAHGVSSLAEYGLIDGIILPKPTDNEANAYKAVLRAAENYGLDVIYYATSEDAVEYNGVTVTVYSGKPNRSSHNAVAVVAEMEDNAFVYYGNKSAELFSSDIGEQFLGTYKIINGTHSQNVKNKDARTHFYERVSQKTE